MPDMTDGQAAAAAAAAAASSPPAADIMRPMLALISTGLFAFAMVAPAFHIAIDAEIKGAVIVQWPTCMAFYFATNKSSATKDATISNLSKGN